MCVCVCVCVCMCVCMLPVIECYNYTLYSNRMKNGNGTHHEMIAALFLSTTETMLLMSEIRK